MLVPLLRNALGRTALFRAARPTSAVVSHMKTAGLSHAMNTTKMSLLARRTFLTTAHVEEPAAADKKVTSTKANSTTKAKAKGTKAKATKKSVKKKKVAAKPKPKKRVVKRKVAAKKPVKYRIRDLKPPFKRPPGAFAAFAGEWYKTHDPKGTVVTQNMAEIAVAWGRLSPTEKDAYKAAPETVAEYRKKKEEWYQAQTNGVKRAIKKRRRSRRIARPVSTYSQFIREFYKDRLPEADNVPFAERARKLAAEFKSLSESEKEALSERSQRDFQIAQAEKAAAAAAKAGGGRRRPGRRRKFSLQQNDMIDEQLSYFLPDTHRSLKLKSIEHLAYFLS
ncbi:hypothetical protein NLJ89_g8967 [Agrocybe chaxingu]|uniref:HMG box domain-containing protein n=1 Tax=Agrocybe chaxingu TaxID=84603 RepID=A0A9W8MQB3_9AGAR|nr:hypothetical protein NLJ89_g8967 [Agrocybe chaxingu]